MKLLDGRAIHHLKTHPDPFRAVRKKEKKHEVRIDDRSYQVGDVLMLQEWDPEIKEYTGEYEIRKVSYITQGGGWGLPIGICVMSLEEIEEA